MTFQHYLEHKQLSAKTISMYLLQQSYYQSWLDLTHQSAVEITYSDLLNFVNHSKQQGYKKAYINGLLNVVRHYYEYLKQAGKSQS